MISRRTLMVSGLGSAALAAFPALARPGYPSALVIVDPALVSAAIPIEAIAASGPALLNAMLPRLDGWRRIEAFVGEADALLLAELVRFAPRLNWTCEWLEAGRETIVGRLRGSARRVIATRT